MTNNGGDHTLNRREVISALSAASASLLAGCGGGGSDGGSGDGGDGGSDGSDGSDGSGGTGDGSGETSNQLGERVPTLRVEYWANVGNRTALMEEMLNLMQPNWEELGIQVELVPKDIGTSASNIYSDGRDSHVAFWAIAQNPPRNDPDEFVRQFSADSAGKGGDNLVHMVNCDYTHPAHEQSHILDEEERQATVNEAASIASEENYLIPTIAEPVSAVYLTDYVDVAGVGDQGITVHNPQFYVESTPTQNDSIRLTIAPITLETTNFLTIAGPLNIAYWNKLVHSPLVTANANFELEPTIASDYTFEDGDITFELGDGTFHNGDPITAEDVKFTFDQVARGAEAGAYPQASPPPYSGIEIVDERTITFEFDTPFAPALQKTFQKWGILHKQTWVDGGAPDNPGEFEFDPMVGSGPFKVNEMRSGQYWDLEAHDGHPKFDPDHGLVFTVYRESQASEQAFLNEEVDIINASTTKANRLREDLGDQMELVQVESYSGNLLYPQHQMVPTKFSAFRHALGAAINRQRLNEIVYSGSGTPVLSASMLYPGIHPAAPPEEELTQFAEDASGNIEAARTALREAGWGWDNNGNLHYPPDADLSPVFPQGEQPTDFPCLNAEGEYVPPE